MQSEFWPGVRASSSDMGKTIFYPDLKKIDDYVCGQDI